MVALRKESVDRNKAGQKYYFDVSVALRKESVDRNTQSPLKDNTTDVALRKESVDRNPLSKRCAETARRSLSARRAWIEIGVMDFAPGEVFGRSPQGERG